MPQGGFDVGVADIALRGHRIAGRPDHRRHDRPPVFVRVPADALGGDHCAHFAVLLQPDIADHKAERSQQTKSDGRVAQNPNSVPAGMGPAEENRR